jgi:hypothetical protein
MAIDHHRLKSFHLTDGFVAVFEDSESTNGMRKEKVVAIGLAELFSGDHSCGYGLSMVSIVLCQGCFVIAEDALNFIGTIRTGEHPERHLDLPEEVAQKIKESKDAKRASDQERLDARKNESWQKSYLSSRGV